MSTKKTKFAKALEVPDKTPLEIPVGFQRPPSLQEQIQRLVRVELSDRASSEGMETFEESEDFGEDDRDDPTSPHELHYHAGTGKEVLHSELLSIQKAEREFDKKYRAYREHLAKEKAEDAAYRRKARKRREIARKKRSSRS